MADAGDYVELTLPTRLSADQRARMIAAHSRLLGILNGPSSTPAAKAGARKAMKELRKQIALLGGRVETRMSNYQSDPTTGEITGVIGGQQPAAPVKPRAIETADAHQVRVPIFLQKPVSTQQMGEGISKAFGETTAQPVGRPAQAAAATPTASSEATQSGQTTPGPGIITPPAQKVSEATGAPLTVPAAPDVAPVAVAQPAAAGGPTVPSETEDLNADPTLAALAPPPAAAQPPPQTGPAKTPEMQRLEALLAQPEPAPPDLSLSIGQKIAYGALAGLQGADKVAPLIAGQKAEAAQKYVLARQTREETINNLVKLVSLQNEQAQQQTELRLKQQSIAQGAAQTAAGLNQLHATAAPVLNTAITYLQGVKESDPATQARAQTIIGQIQEVQAAAKAAQAAHDRDPLSVNPEQLAFYRSRIDQLTQTVDKAIGEQIARVKENKLPEAVTTQIAALDSAGIGAKQALNMIAEGIGGPIESRFYNLPFVSIVSPQRAEQIGVLDSILQRISAEAARGSTGRLAEFETEVFPSIFLNSTLPVGMLTGRLKGLAAWSEAKSRMLKGQPGAQTEAERALAEAAGWGVVGHTKEGWPVWQSPQGLQYTEQPEAP